ncbi:MAG: DUF4900 domain-containing protein [Candidatus Eremiobacteraeota bacterium]|nr:DUF4900 domain-containing protein [Candidatus Eremiobacteraeota bacterium]
MFVQSKGLDPMSLETMKKGRGIALVLVLFVMIILLLVTITLSSMAMTDNQISLKHYYAKKSFNLARSGIIRASAELKTNPNWGSSPVAHDFGDNGKYTVTVEFHTGDNGRGFWKVTSVGEIGEYKRTIYSWMELQSFSEYLYLTDSERGNVGGRYYTIWFTGNDQLDGPIHTNGYYSFYQNPNFANKVTSSNTGDSYYNQNKVTYRQGGRTYTDPAKFYHYYSNYNNDYPVALNDSPDFSFTGGVSEAEFPGGVSDIKDQADHTINGNVKYIKFLSNGYIEIKPKNKPKFTISSNDTTIFVKGHIQEVYGVVKGKVTVASTGNIKISKDITYSDDEVDMLGLVANNDIIVNTSPYKREDITIHGALMAMQGSFYVNDYNRGIDRGVLHVYGSITQKRRGPVGTFTTRGRYTGYHQKDYKYDPRLKFLRPPDFPTTGKVVVKAFLRDKGALGGD